MSPPSSPSCVGQRPGGLDPAPRAAVRALLAWVAVLALFPLLSSRPARAAAPSVQISGGDSLSLWVLVDWDEPLPVFVQERLRRGIPATAGLRVELWRARPGWFDQHLASAGTELKVQSDPWGGSFILQDASSSQAFDSLGALQEALSRHRVRLPLSRDWCDGDSEYQILVTTFVRPLTTKDAGEVEAWLRGELRGFGGGILGLPRGLFGIVRDLSGLGERTTSGSSPGFRLSRVTGDRVRVLIPGEPQGTGSAGTLP